jgi:hypothetical protein
MSGRDKKFWGNLVYLQSVVKHRFSVGEAIPYHFYAPINEKETLEKMKAPPVLEYKQKEIDYARFKEMPDDLELLEMGMRR